MPANGVETGAAATGADAGGGEFTSYHLCCTFIHACVPLAGSGFGGLGASPAGLARLGLACTPSAAVQSHSSVLASRLTAEVRVARLARMAAQVKTDRRMIFW